MPADWNGHCRLHPKREPTMPGHGPAPNGANKRAGRNAEPVTDRILAAITAERPKVPTHFETKDDDAGT